VPKAEPEIGWTPADRIEPGEYPAYSRSAKVYRDPQFNRWVCAIQFDVMDAALLKMLARLTWFLNLGEADQPHAGRRSAYWDAWLAANGKPPARRDRLSSVVFTKRQARVLVADTELMVETRQERRDTKLITKTATKPAPDAARYSVIRKVLSWETGGTE
jgi:hypothetical protein